MGRSPLSHHLAKFGDQGHCGSKDTMVLDCHVTIWLKSFVTIWIGDCQNKLQPGHRHCGSRDIIFSVCTMIPEDPVKGSCDYIDRIPSRYVTTLPFLIGISFHGLN